VDAERRFSSFGRAHDNTQVLLPKLQESAGIPDHSSVLQQDDDDDGDDDVSAEDGDSKEGVGYSNSSYIIIAVMLAERGSARQLPKRRASGSRPRTRPTVLTLRPRLNVTVM